MSNTRRGMIGGAGADKTVLGEAAVQPLHHPYMSADGNGFASCLHPPRQAGEAAVKEETA